MLWARVMLAQAVIWSAGTAVLTDTLSSNMPMYSLLCTAVLAWALVDGDIRLLPFAALVASYAAQQHLAAGVIVLALVGVAVVAVVVQVVMRDASRRRDGEEDRGAMVGGRARGRGRVLVTGRVRRGHARHPATSPRIIQLRPRQQRDRRSARDSGAGPGAARGDAAVDPQPHRHQRLVLPRPSRPCPLRARRARRRGVGGARARVVGPGRWRSVTPLARARVRRAWCCSRPASSTAPTSPTAPRHGASTCTDGRGRPRSSRGPRSASARAARRRAARAKDAGRRAARPARARSRCSPSLRS